MTDKPLICAWCGKPILHRTPWGRYQKYHQGRHGEPPCDEYATLHNHSLRGREYRIRWREVIKIRIKGVGMLGPHRKDNFFEEYMAIQKEMKNNKLSHRRLSRKELEYAGLFNEGDDE